MKKVKVIAHCLVANEERFIWYALQSALPFVDKIMVWDTGSKDKTTAIVKSISSEKIQLVEKGIVNAVGHTKMRDLMLKETNKKAYDWLLILDGDEVWPEHSLKNLLEEARLNQPLAMVVRTVNFVGDIYHRLPESAGQYRFGDRVGHYNLRLINLAAPDLHVAGPHGQQVYYSSDRELQKLPPGQLLILDNVFYYHATHLSRSPLDQTTLKRPFKKKYELGEKINRSNLPEIFFAKPRSALIPEVSDPAPFSFWLLSALMTIPRRLKRLLLTPKAGY